MLRVNQLSGFGGGGGAGGAVPAYVTAGAVTNFDTATSYSGSYTINASTKAIVVVLVTLKTDASAITFGGTTMTLIGSVSNKWMAYYLNSPASGAQTLAISTATNASWAGDDGGATGASFQVIELSAQMTPGALQSDTVTAFAITVGTSGVSGVSIVAAARFQTNSSISPTISGTGFVSTGTAARSETVGCNFADSTAQWGYATNSGTPLAFSCRTDAASLIGFACEAA